MSGRKVPELMTASPADIAAGKVTDVYFTRTREILEGRGIRARARAEFMAKSLPGGWPWALFAGLEEVARLLEGVPVTLRALPEGTAFGPYAPVMDIEGPYLDYGVFETALLGLVCQASGIATAAARCVKAADGRPVVSFGARRMHPAIAPMVERSAYAGGCAGVATLQAADMLGIAPTGTIPHALVILMGDTVRATTAFDAIIDPGVPRIALVDTFGDEKFEALAVAEALGEKLYGVRVDTTSSRRGDLLRILEEVRWELDRAGHDHVKLFTSGGLNEASIPRLNPVADAYGVGTAISAAATVDFSMDIVEVDGRPLAKRGKRSGGKDLWRCRACLSDLITPLGRTPADCPRCGGRQDPLLVTVLEDGRPVRDLEPAEAIRERSLAQAGGREL